MVGMPAFGFSSIFHHLAFCLLYHISYTYFSPSYLPRAPDVFWRHGRALHEFTRFSGYVHNYRENFHTHIDMQDVRGCSTEQQRTLTHQPEQAPLGFTAPIGNA